MEALLNTGTASASVGLLADHHRELDRQFEELLALARGGDGEELRRAWTAFEWSLLRHLDLEESELLPRFAQQDPGGARAILADHAAIRRELLELGVSLDLHLVRSEAVEGLVRRLKDHARREDAALYPWAGAHVPAARWQSIGRALSETAPPPTRTPPKSVGGQP